MSKKLTQPDDVPAAEMSAPKKKPAGIDYLNRVVDGAPRIAKDQKVAFAMAIEKGFAVATRIQLMFVLRTIVENLVAVVAPDPTAPVEFPQTDPVLRLLDEAGAASAEFIAACGPLLALKPQLSTALEKLNLFLANNEVIESNRRSLTQEQVVGLAIARIEKQCGLRLQPLEVEHLLNDLDVFDGNPPNADAWKEILWKMRGRVDEHGTTMSEPHRGTLLSDLEYAATPRTSVDMKKPEGQ